MGGDAAPDKELGRLLAEVVAIVPEQVVAVAPEPVRALGGQVFLGMPRLNFKLLTLNCQTIYFVLANITLPGRALATPLFPRAAPR